MVNSLNDVAIKTVMKKCQSLTQQVVGGQDSFRRVHGTHLVVCGDVHEWLIEVVLERIYKISCAALINGRARRTTNLATVDPCRESSILVVAG